MAVKKNKKTPRTISMKASIIYFVISLVINSLGNVLTLVTSAKVFPSFLGSAYWTAAETNFGIALLDGFLNDCRQRVKILLHFAVKLK